MNKINEIMMTEEERIDTLCSLSYVTALLQTAYPDIGNTIEFDNFVKVFDTLRHRIDIKLEINQK